MSIEWKKILVLTDFSEGSKDALPYAVGAAREMGAELMLVHVVNPPPKAELLAFGVVLEEKMLVQQAQKQLPEFREREIPSEIPGAAVVMKGKPWEEITRLAAERKVDLIAGPQFRVIGDRDARLYGPETTDAWEHSRTRAASRGLPRTGAAQ